MQYIYSFLVSFVLFIGLDWIWIGNITRKFYSEALAPIGRMKDGLLTVNIAPALVVYVLLSFAFAYFIYPAIETKGLLIGVVSAFILGVCIYGVYEFTNYSTLAFWPKSLLIIDTLWGGVLSAIVAFVYYWIMRLFS